MRPADESAAIRREAEEILRRRQARSATRWVAPAASAGGVAGLVLSLLLMFVAGNSFVLHLVGSLSASLLATGGCAVAARLQPMRAWADVRWVALNNLAAIGLAVVHAAFVTRRLL